VYLLIEMHAVVMRMPPSGCTQPRAPGCLAWNPLVFEIDDAVTGALDSRLHLHGNRSLLECVAVGCAGSTQGKSQCNQRQVASSSVAELSAALSAARIHHAVPDAEVDNQTLCLGIAVLSQTSDVAPSRLSRTTRFRLKPKLGERRIPLL
jgi:hypothetical protein